MSSDYIEVDFAFRPMDDDEMDILAALLAEYGYDSFETVKTGMKAYVNSDVYDEKNVDAALQSYRFHSKITWQSKLIKSDNWNSEWEKNSFTPIVIGDECVVHATYHDDFPACKYDVVINPRMSFGSGHHETTSMLIENLLASDLEGLDVIDMGAGTGILSIVASKVGAKSVTGIEIDEGAYENACGNCALNDVNVNMIHGDASSLENVAKCDVFIANINRNIILNDIEKYVAAMNDGGVLMISGFYGSDLAMLDEKLQSYGLALEHSEERNDWTMAKFVLHRA